MKPGFFKNEELARCSYEARLLYAGLWMLADRDGRMEDRPRRIRIEVFPYDLELDIDRHLSALADAGFIQRYVVKRRAYLWIPTFLDHQKPHPREAPSTVPPPEARPRRGLGTAQARPRHGLGLSKDTPRQPVLDPVSDPVNSIQTKERTPVSSPVDLDLSGLRSKATGEDAGIFAGKKR